MKRTIGIVVVVIVAGLVLIQLIPYGHNHTNPPVVQEPAWDSPATRALAVRACFDCHSNQTDWTPWYTNIAPISWLVQHDVDSGRQRLNFSEWNRQQRGERGGERGGVRDIAESVQNGSMPRWFYVPLHPEANLSPAERQQLINGLQALPPPGP